MSNVYSIPVDLTTVLANIALIPDNNAGLMLRDYSQTNLAAWTTLRTITGSGKILSVGFHISVNCDRECLEITLDGTEVLQFATLPCVIGGYYLSLSRGGSAATNYSLEMISNANFEPSQYLGLDFKTSCLIEGRAPDSTPLGIIRLSTNINIY